MKAAVCTRFGPPEVLQIREVPNPTLKRGELLVRVRATTVTASDTLVRSFRPGWWPWRRALGTLLMGRTRPRLSPILGMIFAGDVVDTNNAQRFAINDRVVGWCSFFRAGTNAEYVAIKEKGKVLPMPPDASYDQATAWPYGAMIALHFLRKANVQPGQNVLIYGASGSIGTAAVQLAKHFGATVTGVCSTTNLEMVRSLGADVVIDYTREDFTAGSARYDLVLNAVGLRKARLKCEHVLSPNGKHITVDDELPKLPRENFEYLGGLFASGRLGAMIDRTYPLERIAEAHAYVDLGHKKGNVIITV